MRTWDEVRYRLRGIPYLMSESQAEVLYRRTRELSVQADLLEIGAWKGYSTCALAYACEGTGRHVWTIDTFHGSEESTDVQCAASHFNEFWNNVSTRSLDRIITPLVGRSELFYSTWNRPIDLLFIDGGHTPEIVQGDIMAFLPWLTTGGVLLLHDVYETEWATEHPHWMGLDLPLHRCDHNDNLAWGYKL